MNTKNMKSVSIDNESLVLVADNAKISREAVDILNRIRPYAKALSVAFAFGFLLLGLSFPNSVCWFFAGVFCLEAWQLNTDTTKIINE